MTRENITQRHITKLILLSFFLIQTVFAFAQKPDIIIPGSQSVNSSLLHTGNFLWENAGGFAFDKTGKPIERFVTVNRTAKEIIIEERINDKGRDVVKRKTILNAKTLEPIRANAETDEFSYNIQLGSKVKGELENFKSGKKEKYDVPIEEKFFLESSLDFVISALPLKPGYKAFIPVVTFDNGYRSKLERWEIKEIKEVRTFSCMSGGAADAFQVELRSNLFSDPRELLIDKNTRRIIKSSILNSYTQIHYVDKEIHINPIKTKFDAVAAKAMINQGTARISGQAYTTDPNRPGNTKSLLFGEKKIRAPKGSIVMLVPNTPYLKEWLDFNAHIRKTFPPEYLAGVLYKGCHGYPLPLEVKEQSLVAEVTDSKGSFTFNNLKPGEYHVYVQFTATKYTHTTRTPTGGYSIYFDSEGTAVASPDIDVKHWGSPTDVTNYKLVKIAKDGETVKVKLNN